MQALKNNDIISKNGGKTSYRVSRVSEINFGEPTYEMVNADGKVYDLHPTLSQLNVYGYEVVGVATAPQRDAPTFTSKADTLVIDEAVAIYGENRGVRYDATLLPDGTIDFAEQIWKSPSAAAKAALARSANGWTFWKTERDGKVLSLSEMRG